MFGNHQIVTSLSEQFVSHGIAHGQKVADSLLPLLRGPLRDRQARDEIVSRFQSVLRQPHALVGYAVYLVDTDLNRIIASSESGQGDGVIVATDGTRLLNTIAQVQTERLQHAWVVREETAGQEVALTDITRVAEEPALTAPTWYLAVDVDITDFINAMHDLHYRLSAMLLLSAALIAAGGVLVARRIGRSYERFLEGTVRERTRQLREAHAEMLRKARLAILGQTASMLAHEIRNPLASIKMGLSGLISADYLRERDSRRAHIALSEVDRLNEMLSDALNYVRPVKPSKEPIPLDRLVDSVVRLMEPALLERGLRLQRTTCPQCPNLRIDISQMEQVVLNLLKNAMEATPDGGEIGVAVSGDNNNLRVDVTNAGSPIPPDEMDRLFEPFYTTKPKGTGLGLMLVKRVVEEHGGKVHVTSSVETGTRFAFTLPVPTLTGEATSLHSEAKSRSGGRSATLE